MKGLNPCFNGGGFRSTTITSLRLVIVVLILVLMEVGLGGVAQGVRRDTGATVLILVLMEVGLGGHQHQQEKR